MRRIVLALAFTCVLSSTVLAGNIPTSGIAPPPPDEPNAVVTLILTLIGAVV